LRRKKGREEVERRCQEERARRKSIGLEGRRCYPRVGFRSRSASSSSDTSSDRPSPHDVRRNRPSRIAPRFLLLRHRANLSPSLRPDSILGFRLLRSSMPLVFSQSRTETSSRSPLQLLRQPGRHLRMDRTTRRTAQRQCSPSAAAQTAQSQRVRMSSSSRQEQQDQTKTRRREGSEASYACRR
jgi:hypothetical protein